MSYPTQCLKATFLRQFKQTFSVAAGAKITKTFLAEQAVLSETWQQYLTASDYHAGILMKVSSDIQASLHF